MHSVAIRIARDDRGRHFRRRTDIERVVDATGEALLRIALVRAVLLGLGDDAWLAEHLLGGVNVT